jgi:hypothetical protein
MLFDLRGRGRRRTVKIVYVTLAFLMGGGLVFFGIGGDVSGGLVDAITERGAGGDDGTQRAIQRERDAAAKTRANPQDAEAWAGLARARFQNAGIGENFDPNSNTFTASGKAKLAGAAQAWEKYLALDPEKPDDRVAGLMVQAYSPAGLNRPTDVVRAQEIITEVRPKDTTFAQLAIYAYAAGQARKGDLARKEALRLADPEERNRLKSDIDQAKQQATLQNLQQNASPTATPKGE